MLDSNQESWASITQQRGCQLAIFLDAKQNIKKTLKLLYKSSENFIIEINKFKNRQPPSFIKRLAYKKYTQAFTGLSVAMYIPKAPGRGEYDAQQYLHWINYYQPVRFHNKIPVIQAVIKQAIEPAIKALIPNLAKSDWREGAIALMPPIWIPIEPILEKPQRA